MALSITTFSMTLGIKVLFVTHIITTLPFSRILLLRVLCFIYCYAECHYAECDYAECRYAEFHVLFIVMLNVILLSLIMLNVMLSFMSFLLLC
jgi:hypothetical protein